jgi:hypothetical protein
MPKPGDRVVVEGSKVGGGRREGTLLETLGSLIKVRWTDGGETILAPGAGAVRFLPGSAKASKSTGATPKKAASAKAKPAAKGKAGKKR